MERHPLVRKVHTKRFTAKARHQYAVIGEHLSFEGLISDLMARFVRTPNTQSDLEIEDAIRRICLFLGLDQGLIVQWRREGAPMPTHSWTAAGGLPPPVLPGTEVVPWVHSQSALGNIVMFSRLEDLPAEAARDKEFFRVSGRKSLISLPLKIEGSVIGVLVFASLHAEIPWPDEVVLRLELIGDFFAGILDRKNKELELEKRLRFEHLLFDLSARFVNIAPDKVEEEIEHSLKRILEFFEVDRCGLLKALPNRKSYQVALVAYAKGIPPVPEKTDLPFSLFPWASSRVLDQHEIVYVKSTDDLPPEADVDRQSYQSFGIKSCMTIPILASDSVTYVLSIDAVSEIRAWPEDYGPRLRLLGEVFVSALERRRVNEALQVSEERLSLAADSSGAYLWHLESGSGRVWITDKGREFFGLTSDNEMDFERFMNVVHSEDREKLRKTVEETMRFGKDNSAEYRIVQPDGNTRWVLSRGRAYQAAEGKPARLMGVSIDITERKKTEEALKESYTAIAMLKEQLAAENIYLRGETNMPREFEDVIGESDALKYVFFRVQQVAATDTTVLITGETGTGKGLVARALHRLSERRDRPMVMVNCAALPASLIESELFGREKGAFTGAHAAQIGRFEIADKGTIFLDEIGELPPELQAKLLRVVDEGEFERLGSPRTIKVDVRIVASTNRDLMKEIREGRFREDLYYRLNVFQITMPPLSQRKEDIPLLVRHFVEKHAKKMGKTITEVPSRVIKALGNFPWPGNVRELENVVERAVVATSGYVLQLAESVEVAQPREMGEMGEALSDVERVHILRVMKETFWRIEGPNGAARILGLKPSTLRGRMKKLGIQRDRP